MDFLNNLSPTEWNDSNFFLFSGPCAVESEHSCLGIAEKMKELTDGRIPYVFKASYRKANRSSLDSFTGIGDEKALAVLAKVKKEFELPILTDVHSVNEIEAAAEVADILQIPAFLCRQTDLLVAAAKSGKIINVKKGQFLSPESMKHAVGKLRGSGCEKIMLTERGVTFGYHDLVVDFRSIPKMAENKVPIVMDCTHALQKPNQSSGVTGGTPAYIETLAKCGLVSGAHALFIETHPSPAEAKSDGANMLALDEMPALLDKLLRLKQAL